MSAARQHPVPMRFVGLRDTFAESGKPEELLAKYGLTAADIVRESLDLL
jgi:transketolase